MRARPASHHIRLTRRRLLRAVPVLPLALVGTLAARASWLRRGAARSASRRAPDEALSSVIGIGVYDPDHAFAGVPYIRYEHTFIAWNAAYDWGEGSQYNRLVNFLSYAKQSNRIPVVTLEPWEVDLARVATGAYDANVEWVAAELRAANVPVLVRFMHEMDIGARYPWAMQGASRYVAAYNYVTTRLRTLVPGVKLIWSPAGNANLKSYYPGPANVDYVGLSCYCYPTWEAAQSWSRGIVQPFVQNFGKRYDRVKRYNKPVILAELGAVGKERYRWLEDAFGAMPSFPLLGAALLYNAMETGDYGDRFSPPDWRLDPDLVVRMVS